MTPTLWEYLEKMSKGTVMLDIRGNPDLTLSKGYLKLLEYGYCTLVETGPGDSIMKFSITQKGREALAGKS